MMFLRSQFLVEPIISREDIFLRWQSSNEELNTMFSVTVFSTNGNR